MKKTVLFTIATTALVASAAVFVEAQNFLYVENWLKQALRYLQYSITILMIAMTLFFLWRVFQLIRAKDANAQTEARKAVFQAMLGLFLAVAVWGIIRIAGGIIGVDVNNQQATPNVTCPPGMVFDRGAGICTIGTSTRLIN